MILNDLSARLERRGGTPGLCLLVIMALEALRHRRNDLDLLNILRIEA